jgi:hypothetical protein
MQHAMSAFTRVRVSAGQWRDDPRRRDVLVDGVRAFLAVSLFSLAHRKPLPGDHPGVWHEALVSEGSRNLLQAPLSAAERFSSTPDQVGTRAAHPTDRLGGALESAGRLACI